MAQQFTTPQFTEGQGKAPEHTHGSVTHTHDHYHLTHHHKDGAGSEWEHRTFWHTHPHNHNELVHSHDYSHEAEDAEHGKEAHIHDHAAPTKSPG
jgi:hypothetical protein